MLRRDTQAGFEKSGVWVFAQYRFASGSVESRKALSGGAYGRLRRAQAESPVLVLVDDEKRRRWWMYCDDFFCDDDGYEALEVKALVLERLNQRERRVKRAVALMEQSAALGDGGRFAIPDEVKAFVWNRDGGRCVRCAGRERLEFDHVIPLSMGGSNTARNLQILCESCNRAKGASLV